MIVTRDLTKRFGSVVAVDGLTTSVEGPGVVGFLGPNGAGKTTTIRMITGFLSMTSGTAVVAGHDVFEEPLEVKARVGYLPETPPLVAELTVGEYLTFVAEIRGLPRARRLSAVGGVMERVGLRGWEKALCGSLSKGYRQRVGIAQALVHDPPLLVLDEPTSGLDPAQLVAIRALILELARERTVVLSTHVLPEVEALCERVLLVHRGRLVGDGTVDALAAGVGAGPWVELAVDATEDLSARIAALPAVDEVERLSPGRYRVRGGADVEPALAAACRDLPLRGLVRHQASLEEVFLALVGAEA